MAKVFFDTNYFIYLHTKKIQIPITFEEMEKHDNFVSTLTYHIMAYIQKVKIPDVELARSLDKFYVVNYGEKILQQSLTGPTKDLEDNIQLHSAAEAECDFFLTNDKDLLKMKFFGKTRVLKTLPVSE